MVVWDYNLANTTYQRLPGSKRNVLGHGNDG